MAKKTDFGLNRRRILESARKILMIKGYQRTRMEDIAREAGMAKGTVYLYFKNKEFLLVDLMEEGFLILGGLIKQSGREKGALAKLQSVIKLQLAFFEENRELFSLIHQEMPHLVRTINPVRQKEMFKKMNRLTGEMAKIIKLCKQEGLIRKDMEPDLGAGIYFSLVRAFIFWQVHSFSKKPLTEENKRILDIFLKGVGK